MTRKTKWVLGPALGLTLLLSLGWATLGRGKDPVVYTVDTVKRGDLRESTAANGEIQAKTRVNVGVQVTAAIKVIHVKDGQFVQAGDLLVTLEQENYRQSVTQSEVGMRMARKDLEVAQASFRKQEDTFRRMDALVNSGLISREDHQQAKLVRDTAEAAFGRARLAVQQAEAQVAIAQDALSKTEIRASMAGRITNLKAEKGETAIAGQTSIAGAVLMVIADTSELLAEVKVGELDVVKLRPGQPAEIQVDAAPGKVFQGRVLEVASSVDRNGQMSSSSMQDAQNYRVRVQVLGTAPELEVLHPGMSARVAVLAKEVKDVVTVPLQAIQEREGKTGGLGLMSGTRLVVFVVKNGIVEERTLKTGAGTRRALQVLEGLAAGEQVLTGPAKAMAALATGAAVKTQTEQEALKGRGK
jgi:HlyD family secretion protein